MRNAIEIKHFYGEGRKWLSVALGVKAKLKCVCDDKREIKTVVLEHERGKGNLLSDTEQESCIVILIWNVQGITRIMMG